MASQTEPTGPNAVFYSWQSDLPETKEVIHWALQEAIQNINRELILDGALRLDQDTQDVAGWPEITSTILDKITECEIFVADITPINGPISEFKLTPNPNVLLELGYALGTGFGRKRIICVINTHYLPDNDLSKLPFDLRASRPVQFMLEDPDHRGTTPGEEDSTLISSRNSLKVELENSTREIMEALQSEQLAAQMQSINDNLTFEARSILQALIEQTIDTNDVPRSVKSDCLEQIRAELGMSEDKFAKETARLEREGYIEIQLFFEYSRLKINSQGIIVYYKHKDYAGFSAAYKQIAAWVYKTVVIEKQQPSIIEVAELTNQPPVLVNAILEVWECEDLVKIGRRVGGLKNCIIWQVNPLLEDKAD